MFYKYLNGGPGALVFLGVAPRHQGGFQQPLTGWFAHAAPFAFSPRYEPATDISQYLCGTAPVLSMIALDAALDVWDSVDGGTAPKIAGTNRLFHRSG